MFPAQTYGLRKQSKCIFDSDSRSSFAEFEISEFEISRFDCIKQLLIDLLTLILTMATIVPYANSLDQDEMPSNQVSHP